MKFELKIIGDTEEIQSQAILVLLSTFGQESTVEIHEEVVEEIAKEETPEDASPDEPLSFDHYKSASYKWQPTRVFKEKVFGTLSKLPDNFFSNWLRGKYGTDTMPATFTPPGKARAYLRVDPITIDRYEKAVKFYKAMPKIGRQYK